MNSVVAMRLMAQIQQKFGKTLPLATLLESPTIENLANLLRSATDTQTSSSLVAIQLLIFASEKPQTKQFTSWGKLAKASVVYQIEGNHYTIIQEPQVMVLAEHLALGLI
ncbi:phosphopantetheine-binding protein [Dapis sp. BLCC M229]|uniref:phosphopantetheine-binding protein n=1 Tax=Dapis sp. BLCC M229 TaxID=3400188 RepID=UPI003CEE47EB